MGSACVPPPPQLLPLPLHRCSKDLLFLHLLLLILLILFLLLLLIVLHYFLLLPLPSPYFLFLIVILLFLPLLDIPPPNSFIYILSSSSCSPLVVLTSDILCLCAGSGRLQYQPSLCGGALHRLLLLLLQTLRRLTHSSLKYTIKMFCRVCVYALICSAGLCFCKLFMKEDQRVTKVSIYKFKTNIR